MKYTLMLVVVLLSAAVNGQDVGLFTLAKSMGGTVWLHRMESPFFRWG